MLWIVSGYCTAIDGSTVGFSWWFILMDLTQIPPFLFLFPILLPHVSPTAHCHSHTFQIPRRQMDGHSTSHHFAFQGCWNSMCEEVEWVSWKTRTGCVVLCKCICAWDTEMEREWTDILPTLNIEWACTSYSVNVCCMCAHEGTGVRLAGGGSKWRT